MSMRFELDPNAFEHIDAAVDDYIRDDVLPNIVDRAKRIVPVDTHRLQESIHATSDETGHWVIADTEYAYFVETGTSLAPAQPYLRPSMSSKLPERGGN